MDICIYLWIPQNSWIIRLTDIDTDMKTFVYHIYAIGHTRILYYLRP